MKSSVYEIGSMGISGFTDDETITVQETVTSCGCRRKVFAVQTMKSFDRM